MLEFLITFSHITLLLSFIIFPIIILRKLKAIKTKHLSIKFTLYLILICSILSTFSAFWKDYSTEILLRSYNAYEFNPDIGTEQVEYKNVRPKNLEKVKRLEQNLMGIGWPLKAIFIFILSIGPVFVLTYFITEIIEKIMLRKSNILKNEK